LNYSIQIKLSPCKTVTFLHFSLFYIPVETPSGRKSYSTSNSRVIKGNLRIEPDLDDLKTKTFIGKTVQSKKRWSKGLFKMRFMFPLNDNIWSTIYLFGAKANIDFVSQISNEKLSHDIQTGVVLHTHDIKTGDFQHSYKSFREVEKQTPIHNMTHSFNEVSMEWTNEKIVWKLNDQHINEVNLKRFSSRNEIIDQIFNTSFRLIIELTLRQEFYNDSNFNLNDMQKSCLDIDYIRVYKWKETEINTQSYPVTNNTMTPVVNPVANVTMTTVMNPFSNYSVTTVVNPIANNTMTSVVNSSANNSVTTIIIPVLLVILVVLIIIAIVYWKLKTKHQINYNVFYQYFPLLNEKL
jgi:beta-glucanase (GH16 family)